MNDMIKKLNTLGTLFIVLAALCMPASFIAPVMLFQIASDAESQARTVMMLAAVGGTIGSLLLASCIALVGISIRKRRWWTLCFVVSILLCPAFPLGTALGIISLKTLTKPEVKEIFSPNNSLENRRA
jgi:chromate transport protein ChrA